MKKLILIIFLLPYITNAQSKLKHLDSLLVVHNIKHKDIVIRQALLESANFKSKAARQRNNIFGIANGKKHFNSIEDCVLLYKYKIQNRLRPGENYYCFLTRIKYASDPKYNFKLKHIKYKI